MCYNIDMGKHKGFTFIEVALFMAVTAALFIAIALGMQNAIFRQRYDDSTQRFFEFMRSVYSDVSNPQSAGEGNSNYAIYGKLIVFGETVDMLGNAIDTADEQPIFTYDVVGRADGTYTISTGKAVQLLANLDVNVVFFNRNSWGTITGVNLASPEEFIVPWGARVENTDRTDVRKSILVVRHPRSGTISTLVYNDTIQVNQEVKIANAAYAVGASSTIGNLLKQYLSNGSFSDSTEVDFCINPYGPGEIGSIQRRNVRILSNARNASSVEMTDMDGDDNRCV